MGLSKNSKATLSDFIAASKYISQNNRLPDDFTEYHWANQNGWSIAHKAAMRGVLPDWFRDYALKTSEGLTVAHVAARYGHLPPWFDNWHWRTKAVNHISHSVIEVFVCAGLPNCKDRCALFDLKVWPDEDLTVAEYILDQHSDINEKYRDALKSEVLAWRDSQVITKNVKEAIIIKANFKKDG